GEPLAVGVGIPELGPAAVCVELVHGGLDIEGLAVLEESRVELNLLDRDLIDASLAEIDVGRERGHGVGQGRVVAEDVVVVGGLAGWEGEERVDGRMVLQEPAAHAGGSAAGEDEEIDEPPQK